MKRATLAAITLACSAVAANAQVNYYNDVYVGASGSVSIYGDGFTGSPGYYNLMGYIDPSTNVFDPVASNKGVISYNSVDYSTNGSVTLTGLTPGSELILAMLTQAGYLMETGPGYRNADGDVHGIVQSLGGDSYQVNFEDLEAFQGSDFNYGDGSLLIKGDMNVTTTSTPGPAALAPFAVGLLGLIRRKRAA